MPGGTGEHTKKKRRLWPYIVLLVVGMAVLAYPLAADIYATWRAQNAISEMTVSYEPLDDPELLACLERAEAYNARMAGLPAPDPDPELDAYDKQLRYKGVPQMAWIEIPKIAVKLPVYHHADDEASLSAGVGHMQETSLPVGGEGSHCVMAGHSGMEGERMFDDISRLEEGDVFVIHTLEHPYAYRVYATEVVLPEELADHIKVEPGRDLCTLVTCTPYLVNTHRLLVHAERCEYVEDDDEFSLADTSTYVNNRTVPLAIGIVFVAVVLGITAITAHRSKKKKSSKKNQKPRG